MFYTYLLASAPHGTLYVGHTDDLSKRVSQHRLGIRANFTSRYGVHRLVWYAAHHTRAGAFGHERRIKKWNRAWKVRLIETNNPAWSDLFDEWYPPTSNLAPLGLPPSRE